MGFAVQAIETPPPSWLCHLGDQKTKCSTRDCRKRKKFERHNLIVSFFVRQEYSKLTDIVNGGHFRKCFSCIFFIEKLDWYGHILNDTISGCCITFWLSCPVSMYNAFSSNCIRVCYSVCQICISRLNCICPSFLPSFFPYCLSYSDVSCCQMRLTTIDWRLFSSSSRRNCCMMMVNATGCGMSPDTLGS